MKCWHDTLFTAWLEESSVLSVEHDPNNEWRKYAFYKHAVALMHLHDYTNAELAINSCLEIEKGRGDIPTLDVLQNMRIEIAAQPKKVVKTATNKKTMQPV